MGDSFNRYKTGRSAMSSSVHRRIAKRTHGTNWLSFLCGFAPLREYFLPVGCFYETNPLRSAPGRERGKGGKGEREKGSKNSPQRAILRNEPTVRNKGEREKFAKRTHPRWRLNERLVKKVK